MARRTRQTSGVKHHPGLPLGANRISNSARTRKRSVRSTGNDSRYSISRVSTGNTLTSALIAAISAFAAILGVIVVTYSSLVSRNSDKSPATNPSSSDSPDVNVPTWAVVTLTAFAGILAAMFIFYLLQKYRLSRLEVQHTKEMQEREFKAMDSALDRLRERMTLPSLVELNRLMLDKYHGIATDQANSSYISSKRAMWAGFTWLLLCSIGGATVAVTTGEKIILVSLAAIGGGLAAFLSRTYIRVYERSLEQLNQYFSQPLLNSYYLTAERLISEMSPGERDRARNKLLDQLLQGSGSIISDNSGPHGSNGIKSESRESPRNEAVEQ